MADESTLGLSSLAGIPIIVFLFITWYRRDPLLDAIPTVGFSDPILSYLSAFRYLFGGLPILKEGYEKNKPGIFKIATFRRWMVLPTGAKLIEDIKKAPDDVLSFQAPIRESIQTDYTLNLLNMEDSYHASVIRSRLTRNIATTFDQVRDELAAALGDCIPTAGEEWVKVPILPTAQRIICRTSSRVFVGAPLCRDRDYETLVLNSAVNVMKSATIIAMFPRPLKSTAARVLCSIPSQVRRATELIGPLVEERLTKMEELGDAWNDAPNDMLMWLMSEAKGVEKSVEGLVRRMLIVNFASIHTTSFAFMQVLYRLLAHPEYIEPLRQEIEAAVAEEGWTKAGMDKMHKIDSFLRETQRLDNRGLVTMRRLALRPFTFSNGLTIPAGTLMAIPAGAIHTDGEIYPNPEEFDGFRFSKLREMEGDTMLNKHQAVSISPEQLTFGLGRHACPGRFFAVNEVKALLAHVIVTYDVKFEEGKGAPREIRIGSTRYPRSTNVLFRKRQK
ncbi:cytochrome P450 [Lactifluus subvellereus]|nr:cytochrome P450 [Lactifluus subvellereus]